MYRTIEGNKGQKRFHLVGKINLDFENLSFLETRCAETTRCTLTEKIHRRKDSRRHMRGIGYSNWCDARARSRGLRPSCRRLGQRLVSRRSFLFFFHDSALFAFLSQNKGKPSILKYLKLCGFFGGMLTCKSRNEAGKQNFESLVEEISNGGDSKMQPWSDDLMPVLQILHSKVNHKSIATVGFMAEIISNDAAFAGNCDAAVFARILAKAGTIKVRRCM